MAYRRSRYTPTPQPGTQAAYYFVKLAAQGPFTDPGPGSTIEVARTSSDVYGNPLATSYSPDAGFTFGTVSVGENVSFILALENLAALGSVTLRLQVSVDGGNTWITIDNETVAIAASNQVNNVAGNFTGLPSISKAPANGVYILRLILGGQGGDTAGQKVQNVQYLTMLQLF